MQNMSMEMPVVTECSVSGCAYNTDTSCRARAITVGSKVHPDCDTYFSMSGPHSKAKQRQAGVGACKMSDCRHNDDYECVADRISVGQIMDRINCLTYIQRAD